MERGYAVVTGPTGVVLRRAIDVNPGDRVEIELAEGALSASVTGVKSPQ